VRHPSLYQVNTRVALREVGARATLDDLPDVFLDRLASAGFDWLWLLGIWQTGPLSREAARSSGEWRPILSHMVPELNDDDIVASPFSIEAYTVHRDYGGDAALARLRDRLHRRNLHLMLDFVPNHVGLDNAWVRTHPDYFIQGSQSDLRDPHNWGLVNTGMGPRVLAHGRDPYFPGWADTLQLDYRLTAVREAMTAQLLAVASRCEGVRCDMAMLLLPDVFARTWGSAQPPRGPRADGPFWPGAIAATRSAAPGFVFMAEAYWDTEWSLQQDGFDYTYDKRLYDRLREGDAGQVRGHLHADAEYQRHSTRFLENHDEPRVAAVFTPPTHQAAAVITYFVPGMCFFHDGQLEGRHIRVPMQVAFRPREQPDARVVAFYERLLACLRRSEPHLGDWQLLSARATWPDNPTWESYVCMLWKQGHRLLLVCVNYGPRQAQCFLPLPVPALAGRDVVLRDLMNPIQYTRSGDEMIGRGLYLDMPPWGYHIFTLE
jgi:hypothetical protein